MFPSKRTGPAFMAAPRSKNESDLSLEPCGVVKGSKLGRKSYQKMQ